MKTALKEYRDGCNKKKKHVFRMKPIAFSLISSLIDNYFDYETARKQC